MGLASRLSGEKSKLVENALVLPVGELVVLLVLPCGEELVLLEKGWLIIWVERRGRRGVLFRETSLLSREARERECWREDFQGGLQQQHQMDS